MTVYMTTTKKRFNSTEKITGGTAINVVWKDKTSITNPVLLLNRQNVNWNYCRIPAWNRGYFVVNIVAVNDNLFEYYLAVDVLGTYSDEIKTKTLFVERSESDGNKWLFDETWTHECNDYTTKTLHFPISEFSKEGTYVIQTIAGGTASSAGGNSIYAVSRDNLSNLVKQLFNTDFYKDLSFSDDEIKTYFNPFQYITSCRWFPINFNTGGSYIKFGWWTSAVQGGIINTDVLFQPIYSATIQMPEAEDWTYYDPNWTRYTLYIPGIGSAEIDPMYAGKKLIAGFWCDVLTGVVNCRIIYETSEVMSLTGQWGVDIQLSQLSADVSNFLTATNLRYADSPGEAPFGAYERTKSRTAEGLISSAIMTISDMASSVLGLGNFSDSYKAAMQPNLALSGANGNSVMLRSIQDLILSCKRYNKLTDTTPYLGKPCREEKNLSELSGFTKCAQANLDINALAEEKIAIKQYMEGGFYLV